MAKSFLNIEMQLIKQYFRIVLFFFSAFHKMKFGVSLKFACVRVYIWQVLNGRRNRTTLLRGLPYLTEWSFDQRLSEVNPDFQAARFDSKHKFLAWSTFQVIDTINRLLHLVNPRFSFSYPPYWYNVYTLLSEECSSLCIECL